MNICIGQFQESLSALWFLCICQNVFSWSVYLNPLLSWHINNKMFFWTCKARGSKFHKNTSKIPSTCLGQARRAAWFRGSDFPECESQLCETGFCTVEVALPWDKQMAQTLSTLHTSEHWTVKLTVAISGGQMSLYGAAAAAISSTICNY